jgi:hypothetical protein
MGWSRWTASNGKDCGARWRRSSGDRWSCPAIARVAAALVERWQNLSDGSVVEVKAEMSRVALEALVGCIFSERLGDPKAVCDATTRYYATCGGLDPFDVLGFPISCRASRGSACATCCAPFTRQLTKAANSLYPGSSFQRGSLGSLT